MTSVNASSFYPSFSYLRETMLEEKWILRYFHHGMASWEADKAKGSSEED